MYKVIIYLASSESISYRKRIAKIGSIATFLVAIAICESFAWGMYVPHLKATCVSKDYCDDGGLGLAMFILSQTILLPLILITLIVAILRCSATPAPVTLIDRRAEGEIKNIYQSAEKQGFKFLMFRTSQANNPAINDIEKQQVHEHASVDSHTIKNTI